MDTTVRGSARLSLRSCVAAGYMESTIGQYAKTIRALTEFASERVYSVELGAEFASMTTSARTGRFSAQRRFDYRRLVAVFDSYVCTGRVDLSVRGRGGGGPRPEVSGFVALDAAWEAEMDRRGLAAATRAPTDGWRAATWCSWKDAGSLCLDGADGASVLAFLESLLGRWAKSSLFWVVSNFRPFLKFTGRTDLVDALNLAGVKRSHAILPVLGDARRGTWSYGHARRGWSARGTRRSPAGAHDGIAGLRHRRSCGWAMSTGVGTRSGSCSRRRATR